MSDKIAILNDTHAGVRNSSKLFLDNAEVFYSEVFFPYCLEHNIKQIVHLGDFFDDRKIVNFKALNHIRKCFLAKLREHGMVMDIILGNHDVYYKNTNDLNSLKELLGHYMNEVHIITEPRVMEYGKMNIAMVPWINSGNYSESVKFIETCPTEWLFGHLELKGFEVLRGVEAHSGMPSDMFKRFEKVLSGHYHTRSERDNITYLGSQMEFTWSDAGDPKYFHVLDTSTRELTPVRNPNTIFKRIQYDDTNMNYMNYDVSECDNKFVKIVVVKKSDLFTFDQFVDRIQSRPVHDLKIAENFSEFIGMNVEDEGIKLEDTTVLLDSYVESVDTDLDKDRLKLEMRSLHSEAQTYEVV